MILGIILLNNKTRQGYIEVFNYIKKQFFREFQIRINEKQLPPIMNLVNLLHLLKI